MLDFYKNKKNNRFYFSKKISPEFSNLLDIHLKSYEDFLTNGISEALAEYFPVIRLDQKATLKVSGWRIERTANQNHYLYRTNGETYNTKLFVKFAFFKHKTDEIKPDAATPIKLVKHQEKEFFVADIPQMTKHGTFIVNGIEKVITPQIVRSPGAYYLLRDENVLNCVIMPDRGIWLDFEANENSRELHMKLNKGRRFSAYPFFLMLGIVNKTMAVDIFGDVRLLEQTFKQDTQAQTAETLQRQGIIEMFKRYRGVEINPNFNDVHTVMRNLFLNEHYYHLSLAGRFKVNHKLDILPQLINHILAEDVIDSHGKVVIKKYTLLTADVLTVFKKQTDLNMRSFRSNYFSTTADQSIHYQQIKIFQAARDSRILNVIGSDAASKDKLIVTGSDLVAAINYFFNLSFYDNRLDDIDSLINRRVRTPGELVTNVFRIGLARVVKAIDEQIKSVDMEKLTLKTLIRTKPLANTIHDFFNTSQFMQLSDQTNPLSELASKRRITSLSPNGLTRERAGFEVRDVHNSSYCGICPIETPEGPNIGLVNYFCAYARIDKHGFIESPHYLVKNGVVSTKMVYLTAIELQDKYVAPADTITDAHGKITDKEIICRFNFEITWAAASQIDYINISTNQIISVTTSCIPFIENNDANRALMGTNMQKQAVPVIRPTAPLVGTGVEGEVAKYSDYCIVATDDGTIEYVDGDKIVLITTKKRKETFQLVKFQRSNQTTCITQRPLVKVGQKITKGQILSDGPAIQNGEIALGQNVLVAFLSWRGYNYEDAIIISDRLVNDDTFTSIHIIEHTCEVRETKLGPEKVTRDVPNFSDETKKYLDERGIVIPGTHVKENDVLVGKITPKGQNVLSAEDKLLLAIFAEKAKSITDNSLRVPIGSAGIVQAVHIIKPQDDISFKAGCTEIIKIFIAQTRKIQAGDKMAGRHGNKGVISRVIPQEDMPYMADGKRVDILLNPLGVPSRMNIGQCFELHLGLLAHKLGIKFAVPSFSCLNINQIQAVLKANDLSPDGKQVLIDGITGEQYPHPIAVGYLYMCKLNHMVDDKLHARSIDGPYSLITHQPLGGKSQNGGQRFGEMEVWALESYGSANLLQEIITYKSDDIKGRISAYRAIISGKNDFQTFIPEAFNVLYSEIKALGIDVIIKREGQDK